jgi:cytochrome oxidase assembly protein ShyY1
VLVINRSQGGTAGRNVVTPLRLDSGSLLLVTRGFVPDAAEIPAAESGRIEVVGRIRDSEVRRTGQLTEASDGELTEFQRLDIDRIAPQLPAPVEPVTLDWVVGRDAATLPWPVPPPELGEGPHLSYAIQWFIFSVCAIVGWVFAVRRSARRKPTPATATPTPASDEAATALR